MQNSKSSKTNYKLRLKLLSLSKDKIKITYSFYPDNFLS